MNKYILISILMTLMFAILPVYSETVNVGNYTITFNITTPYEVQHDSDTATIKTFGGQIGISDWSFTNLTVNQHITSDFIYLDSIKKHIAGEGDKWGQIYAVPIGLFPRFHFVFDTIVFQSNLNITQSVDFYKDVKISRITK